jgi:hypothetical protein
VQAKAGDFAGAAKSANSIPSESSFRSTALSNIGVAQAKAGDAAGANSTAARITDKDQRKYARGRIAKTLATFRHANEAHQMAKRTPKDHQEYAVRSVTGELAAAGYIDAARRIANNFAKNIHRAFALRALAEAQGKKDPEGARRTDARRSSPG